MKKRVIILGSTGSIGTQTLSVIRQLSDRLTVVGLSAKNNSDLLHQQASEFGVPQSAAILGTNSDLEEMCRSVDADIVLVAVAGAAGTRATLAAIECGKDIALATKEVLVAAGDIVMAAARRHGRRLLPVDSEHSAIFQCLAGNSTAEISRILITASGGPFRDWPAERILRASKDDALKHPTWPKMGKKITVDSSTLMNKGLEMIEARWLFDIPEEKIEILIHPQSIVHSMVQFIDGSLIAQLGPPDMKLPIAFALLYPDRVDAGVPHLDLTQQRQALTFEAPDTDRFPCLRLAREALRTGGDMPAVLNGANEEIVDLFLRDAISFRDIPVLLENVMSEHVPVMETGLEGVEEADRWARDAVRHQFSTT